MNPLRRWWNLATANQRPDNAPGMFLNATYVRNSGMTDFERQAAITRPFNTTRFSIQQRSVPFPRDTPLITSLRNDFRDNIAQHVYGQNHYDSRAMLHRGVRNQLRSMAFRLDNLGISVTPRELEMMRTFRTDTARTAEDLLGLKMSDEDVRNNRREAKRLFKIIENMIIEINRQADILTERSREGQNYNEHNFDIFRYPIRRDQDDLDLSWVYIIQNLEQLQNFKTMFHRFVVDINLKATQETGGFVENSFQFFLYSLNYIPFTAVSPRALASYSAMAVSPIFESDNNSSAVDKARIWLRSLSDWISGFMLNDDNQQDFDPNQMMWSLNHYVRKNELWGMIENLVRQDTPDKVYAIMTVVNASVDYTQPPGPAPAVNQEDDMDDDDDRQIIRRRRQTDRNNSAEMLRRIHQTHNPTRPFRQRRIPARLLV